MLTVSPQSNVLRRPPPQAQTRSVLVPRWGIVLGGWTSGDILSRMMPRLTALAAAPTPTGLDTRISHRLLPRSAKRQFGDELPGHARHAAPGLDPAECDAVGATGGRPRREA